MQELGFERLSAQNRFPILRPMLYRAGIPVSMIFAQSDTP